MKLTTETLLALWKKFEGQTITIPPCPTSKISKPKILTGYNYGKSDAPGKIGQCYLIIEGSWTISSVFVGDTPYNFERVYGTGKLYYGPPANGKITVTLSNGEVFVNPEAVGVIDSTPSGTKIPLKYHSRTNGNKPTYYTHKGKLEAGQTVAFRIGPIAKTVITKTRSNGSIGWDNGDLIIKNSAVRGRGIAVLIPSFYDTDYPIDQCWVVL